MSFLTISQKRHDRSNLKHHSDSKQVSTSVSTIPFYYVVFRACDFVTAVNGLGRPGGIQKNLLVKACFTSLHRALQGFPHKIVVLGDKLSEDLASFFQSFNIEPIQGNYGNDESIRQSLKLALKAPAGSWVYFCEDDYIHHPEAFQVIDDLIRHRVRYLKNSLKNPRSWIEPSNSSDLVIFPPDYPDRYQSRQREPSLLYVSDLCHWRQVKNITFTFIAHRDTVSRYADIIRRCAKGARDGQLSRIMFQGFLPRNSALCLSPIPGVAAHMHIGVMTPLVNWQQMLDDNIRDLSVNAAHASPS